MCVTSCHSWFAHAHKNDITIQENNDSASAVDTTPTQLDRTAGVRDEYKASSEENNDHNGDGAHITTEAPQEIDFTTEQVESNTNVEPIETTGVEDGPMETTGVEDGTNDESTGVEEGVDDKSIIIDNDG